MKDETSELRTILTPKDVYLYNTLSRSVEKLETIEPGVVKLYCCGPTVYNYQHIGNLRTYIFEDLLVRTLAYAGYRVEHVMNITDVGHLVSDADEGEDKMALAAQRENKNSSELADFYTEIFFEHCSWLHIKKPSIVCRATDHIEHMLALIRQLEKNGFAYQSGGNVYFDVEKFQSYGDLAKLDLKKLQAGARIVVDEKKRSPLDFALWFTKSKFENQDLQWDSPWGRGYPGWHIECSAMAMHHLGTSIDIHCGGIDHIPVHHTNEIAQSEGASGERFARFWMHGGFLTVSKEKMSKSTGEFLTLDKLKDKGIAPLAYRYMCLTCSYRKELSWSWEALDGAAKSLEKLKAQVISLRRSIGSEPDANLGQEAHVYLSEFKQELFSDLGLPRAVAVFHRALGDEKLSPAQRLLLTQEFDQVLGFRVASWQDSDSLEIPDEIVCLAQERQEARKARNWSRSDELRDAINSRGYIVADTKDGFELALKA